MKPKKGGGGGKRPIIARGTLSIPFINIGSSATSENL
jgi:hypothetical protein